MNISAPFIRRPVGTTLLAVGAVPAWAPSPISSCRSPACPSIDFPAIGVIGGAAGRRSRDDGGLRRRAARATARRHRRRHRAHLGELARLRRSIIVQFDIDRNIDAAARDVQAAINAAATDLPGRPADAALLPQGQPGRRCRSGPRAHLGDAADAARSSTPPIRSSRSASRRCPASPRCASPAPSSRRSACSSIRRASPSMGLGVDKVANAIITANVLAPVGALDGDERRLDARRQRSAVDAGGFPRHRRRGGEWRGGQARRHRHGRARRAQPARGRLVQRQAGGAHHRHQAAQRQCHRDGRSDQGAAAGAEAMDSGRRRHLDPLRSHADDPRQRRPRFSARCSSPSAW